MVAMLEWVISIDITAGIAVLFVAYLVYVVCDWVLYKQVVAGGPADRFVLITGCDSGFGRCVACRLDGAGCYVIATCLTQEGTTALQDTCSSRLTVIQMDVTDEDSVQQAFSVVSELLHPHKGE